MRVLHTLQSAAVAGLMGLGVFATATPALADHVRTRCDNDGDYCWRVWCDHDWDDCHPVPGSVYHRGYYNRSYYGGYNYGGYNGYYGRYRHYGYDNYYSGRRLACDRDGDDCHYTYRHYDDDEDE